MEKKNSDFNIERKLHQQAKLKSCKVFALHHKQDCLTAVRYFHVNALDLLGEIGVRKRNQLHISTSQRANNCLMEISMRFGGYW